MKNKSTYGFDGNAAQGDSIPSPATLGQPGDKDALKGIPEHSNLPWVACHDDKVDGAKWPELQDKSWISPQWGQFRLALLESDGHAQDAAFIVRAVNAHDELVAACETVLNLLEQGILVRDTSNDADSGWMIKSLKLVRDLASIQSAVDKAKGQP